MISRNLHNALRINKGRLLERIATKKREHGSNQIAAAVEQASLDIPALQEIL